MRLPRLSHVSPKLALSVGLTSLLAIGGCESVGSLKNGWFNPGEVGRFEKEPLMLPIVSSLDTGVEEPNDQFTTATDVTPADLVATPQDYVIGRNDLLNISITDLVAPGVETVKAARVSESGNISLPLVGPVKSEGLTEAQLESEIQRVYREANLMPNAQVTVTVQQALARTFSILGSVMRPGQYQITQGDFRILDALVTAGDISSQGVDFLYVIRREGTETAPASTIPAPRTGPQTAPPARDPLAPQSSIHESYKVTTPADLKRVALLVQDAPATPPTDGPTPTIDGRPLPPAANQGATAEPAAPAAPAAPAPAPAPAAPTAMQPAAASPPTPPPGGTGFEFGETPGSSGTNVRVIKVPVTQLKNGDLRYNIVVRAQDMIIAPLPITGEYFMDGHVNRTGVYSLTARNITLKQAVAAAGGYDQLAIPARTEIIRRIGNDKEVFAVVNMDKVSSGQQPDIYLKPNDVVRVGTGAHMPFLAAFRNAFRMTYGFGFLYDRNFAPEQEQQ